MDQHPVTVDVRDLEMANFRGAQTSSVADAERGAILEPGAGTAANKSATSSTLRTMGSFRGLR